MTHPTTQDLLDSPRTLLLTSVGNEAIHGFVDALRSAAPKWRLIGTDLRPDAAGLYRCDAAHTVPRTTSEPYIPALLDLCRAYNVDLLVPLSTRDQDFFSQPHIQAALPCPVMVSDAQAVATANDKLALFEAMAHRPDLLPEYTAVHDPAGALQALHDLCAEHGAALLKGPGGTGGAGMLCVGTPPQELAPAAGRRWWPLERIERLLQRLEPEDFTALSPDLASLIQGPWPRMAVAYLPGQEYSVDMLSHQGHCLGGVVRLRHAAVGGLATVAQTVQEPDVYQAASDVLEATGLSYTNNIQFRRDAQGLPRLLEINPRFPGTIGLTVASGLNLPLASFCMAMGAPPEPLPEPQIGVRVMRYHGSVFTQETAAANGPQDDPQP